MDANTYFEQISQKDKVITDEDLAQASELVLQEIFGIIAAESSWDKSIPTE